MRIKSVVFELAYLKILDFLIFTNSKLPTNKTEATTKIIMLAQVNNSLKTMCKDAKENEI